MCEMFSEWRALSDNLLLIFSKRWENGYSKGLALQTRKRDWNQFKEVFLLCALDSSWELWMVCVGDNKGEKKGGSEEGGNSEAGISARGITWGWHFPCFTALSLVAKNCQKLLQVGPNEAFDTSSVFITCNYRFPSCSSRWWEYLGSRNGKGHGDLWREEQQKEFSRNEDLLLCFAKAEPPCVN